MGLNTLAVIQQCIYGCILLQKYCGIPLTGGWQGVEALQAAWWCDKRLSAIPSSLEHENISGVSYHL